MKPSASKHTPGPWPFDGWSAGDSRGWQIRLGKHEGAQRINVYEDSQSSEADARLVAAAPELLAALAALVEEASNIAHFDEVCSRTDDCDERDEEGCSYHGTDPCVPCECGASATRRAVDRGIEVIAKVEGET